MFTKDNMDDTIADLGYVKIYARETYEKIKNDPMLIEKCSGKIKEALEAIKTAYMMSISKKLNHKM